jgi:cyclic pyranopterin phosphate synthase
MNKVSAKAKNQCIKSEDEGIMDITAKNQLSHINEEGRARMVDVSEKDDTIREAVAFGSVYMNRETLLRISEGTIHKGDVLSVAQVGGIMAAKNTPHIIPMCHPIMLTGCDIKFKLDFENDRIDITAIVKTTGKTGVEMEALTAVSAAALTIYDMCKAIDKKMTIDSIMLLKKSGGKSGNFEREDS